MQSLVNAKGDKIQTEKQITVDQVLEEHMKHLVKLFHPDFSPTIILRDLSNPQNHVIYSSDTLTDVVKCALELQEQYPVEKPH